MKHKPDMSSIVYYTIGYLLVVTVALFCLLPFLLILTASFTPEALIVKNGYSLLPKNFSLEAYKMLFRYPDDTVRAYGVSIIITAFGAAIGLLITAMAAYAINRKDFKYRNAFSFYFFFITLFNGGLVSTYIMMVRYYHLKNSLLALILPNLVNVFYVIVMRTFMNSLPDSLSESAKIDGAGDFTIFVRVILPLTTPAFATIGLFLALDYWNDWYNAMLYITNYKLYPLQYLLYNMLSQVDAMTRLSAQANISKQSVPTESLRMAMTIIAIGPTIVLYPFVQKYFVKGITLGSVKG